MITQSSEDTHRIFAEWARVARDRQRATVLDALRATAAHVRKHGWQPTINPGTGPVTLGQAIHRSFNPDVEVYCLARNAVAAYTAGDDEGWLRRPDPGLNPEAAADVIAWEEGQTPETVLATLTEMVDRARGYDEDYEEFLVEGD